MRSNLAQIFRIRKFLDEIKYPDSQRIAREISQFLNRNKRAKEEKIFNRLHLSEPWEYIRGNCEFCNNNFTVTKDTLIPRIESEQLVYDSLKYIKELDIKNIIDVGTGSGCIAISIAKLLNKKANFSIYATDISKKALKIAKENELNILKQEYIGWLLCNLIEDIPTLKEPTLLVANLPYIPTKQYKKLEKSVLEYEPKIALDGGEMGLDLYEKLFKQLQTKDINIKAIYIETEESIYKETLSLAKNSFPKMKVTGKKDCYSRDRFVLIK